MYRKMHMYSIFYREFQGFADFWEPISGSTSKAQVKDLWLLFKKYFEHLLSAS